MKPEDYWSCKRSPDTWTKEVAEMFEKNNYVNDHVTGSGVDSPEMTLTSSIYMCCSSLHFHILEYKSIRRSTQELALYRICSTTVSDATYQVSRQFAQ